MTTPRKHPSRYNAATAAAFMDNAGTTFTRTFLDPRQAQRYRQRLYAFRSALRAHPGYDPILLLRANCARITLHNKHVIVTFHPTAQED